MKKLILLFISFLSLFANSLAPNTIRYCSDGSCGLFKPISGYLPYNPPVLESYFRHSYSFWGGVAYINHHFYLISWYYTYNPHISFSTACINNIGKLYSVYGVNSNSFRLLSYKVRSVPSFCIARKGYFYVVKGNYWFPDPSNDSSSSSPKAPICAPGYYWRSSKESCFPTFKTQQKQCDAKCGGSYLVKYFNFGSSSTCICYTCNDLLKKVTNYCSSFGYKVSKFTCSSNSAGIVTNTDYNGSVNLNFCDVKCSPGYHLKPGTKICLPNKVNNSDSNSSKSSGSVSDSNNSKSSNSGSVSNSSKSSGSGSVSNSSKSSGSGSSKVSVNCCSLYNNPKIGDSWSQVSPGVWKETQSPYCKISLKNGVCSDLSSNSNSGSGYNNAVLNSISSKISTSNSKLSEINNNINSIINLKPKSSPNGNLDSKTTSFLNGFSETISNIKDAVSNLKSSAGKVQSLLKNPSKVTLFNNSGVNSCPIHYSLYGSPQSLDICNVVSPYRPLIKLFFTLFFSISVLLYFFDVFIRSK